MPISEEDALGALALAEANKNDPAVVLKAKDIAVAYEAQQKAAGLPMFPQQERQREEQFSTLRSFYTDPNHGMDNETLGFVSETLRDSPDSKYKIFNKKYFEFHGVPKDQVDSNIDQLINAYGLKEYNRPISSHKEFFDSIKADFYTQDQVSAMAGEFAVNNVGTLMAESQFLERMEGVPGYAGREEKWKEELFNRKFSIDSRLDPHRATIKLLSSALMTKESVGVEATTMEQVMADRQEVINAPSYEELSQLVMGVPAEDRKLVIAAAIAASANDEAGRKSVLKGLLESFDRGIEGGAADIKGVGDRSISIAMQRDIASGVEVPVGKEASPEEYLEAVRLRVLGGDAYELQAGVMGAIAGKQFAAPSEEVKQQALKLAENEFQVGELAAELRSAAQNEIDPISSEFIAVRGLYSAAQSVPYLVTSLARGGFAINAMSLAGDSYRSLREQNPTMTAEQAQTVSMISGPAQAYVEQIRGSLLTGRLTSFNRFFNQVLGTKGSIPARYLARTAAITGAEMFQENVQQLTPFMVQGIISAVSEDMPNVPVELLYKDMVAQQPELFFAVLPLAIMGGGAGTYSDFRNGRALLSSYDELTAQGLSEAASADIRALAAKGDYDGAQSRLREEFKTLGKDQVAVQEARAKALPKLLAEYKAQQAALDSGIELDILPAILQQRDGKVALRFTNGQEVQYDSHAQAMERFDAIASSAVLDLHRDMITAAKLTTSQMDQGREVKLIISPLDLTTADIEEQGVASAEQLKKRKEIEDVDKGITPKAEEAKARALTEMAANSSQARKAASYVLGSSVNAPAAADSFGDRVIRTTARVYKQANPYTVIEEVAEGDIKFMLTEGRVERPWIITALRQWESQMGDALFRKSITDDSQVDNQDIVEAYSKMVVSYFAGRATAGDQGRIFSKQFRNEIAKALRMDINAVLTGYASLFEAVYRRAGMIEKARKEGTLPADLESFLAKSAGMSPQKVFEREVVKEGEGIARELQESGTTLSVMTSEIPVNRIRRLMQQIDAMYSTGRTEGVENLEAELEILLDKADSDLEGMDENDDADQVGEMLSSNISEADSANPSPEEELINQWYRWIGKGAVDDSESLRETYLTFGAFVRDGTGDSAYVVQPGVTDEQIEEAAKESVANYERRRTAMLRSRVDKVTFSTITPAQITPQGKRHAELEEKFNSGTITPEETAEAQRLVDDKARRSGKLFGKWFHGSPSGVRFEVFDPTKGKSFGRWNSIGSWFTLDRKAAEGWAENYSMSPEGRLTPDAGTVYNSYLFLNNPISVDGYDALLDLWNETTGVDTAEATPSDVERFKSSVRARGYDGIVVANVEGDSPSGANPSQTYAIAFDANQIKSADPFTGVPLDQRFDPARDEITFSTITPAQITPQGKRHAELEAKFNAGTITAEETAEAQRLVDEKARMAGYDQEAWHYSERKFNSFDLEYARTSSDIHAFFFKDERDPYREYGRNEYHVFIKLQNPANYRQAVAGFSPASTDDAGIRQREKLQRQGFDGAIVSREEGGMEYAEIIAFSPNQIKSADPFTGVPLDQRFDPTRDEISFSTITPAVDAEYLALAADPEKNEARLQEMVDAAAKAAGLTIKPWYHGTYSKDIEVFDRLYNADNYYEDSSEPIGIWFTEAMEAASILYGPNITSAYLQLNNFIEFKDKASLDKAVEKAGGYEKFRQANSEKDGVSLPTVRVVFNPNQIKSADPVTYDESGNVIPLSQRFNPARDEISFSVIKSLEYLKNDKRFEKLQKEGRVVLGAKIEEFINEHILLHSPDNAFSGVMRLTDRSEIKGTGGVYYPSVFADLNYFWASTEDKAKQTANHLNIIGEKNGGRVLMALVSAPVEKLFSSSTMARGTVTFFNALAAKPSKSGITKDDLNKMLEIASNVVVQKKSATTGKITPKRFSFTLSSENSLKKNLGLIPDLVHPTKSIFDVRKAFSESIAQQVAAHLKGNESASKYVAGILADAENKHAKRDILKGKLAKASIIQGLGHLFTEPFLRDFQEYGNGRIYAILEVEGEVEAIASDLHESYPYAIVPKNRESKVILHKMDKAYRWQDTVGYETGGFVEEENFLRVMPTGGTSSTKLKVLGPKSNVTAPEISFSTITAIGDIDSKFAAMFSPFQRSPELRAKLGLAMREKTIEVETKLLPIIRSFYRTKKDMQREASAREGFEYDRLLRETFGADTPAKQDALPAVDRQAARSDAKRIADQWMEGEMKKKEVAPRETLIGFLRTLDAIQRTLPVEVRGKIGGFVALAELSTPAAMLEEIERRVKRIDSELEKYLKKEAEVRRKKLFKRAKPKREAGKKPSGKAGADIHDLFDRLADAMLWDGDQAEAWATMLEAKIAKGELTPEAEAHAAIEANLVRLFSDWNDTYTDTGKKGKNGRRIVKLQSRGADAARRTAAIDAAEEVFRAGYLAEQTRIAKERERRAQIRADIIKGTGKLGNRSERAVRAQKDAGLSGQWKEWFLSLFNFDQVLGFAFGAESKWTTWFADQQRTAENQKIDEVQSVLDGLDNLFRTLGGSRLGGEKLQWKLSQQSFATKQGGMMSELEGITAILMWRQEDGKRHMKGKRDENGKITSTWAYDQSFIDEIGRNLSKEGLAVMDYLINEYAGEYETLNPIFREINGINLPRNSKYSPLSVKPQQAPNGQTTDPVTGSTMSNGSMTPGSLRTRAQVVAEPDFRNAIEVFVGHKKQLAHWKAFAVFVRDAQAILGNREVSNSIEASSGQEAIRVIRSWLDMFAQGGVRDAGSHLALTKALAGATGRAAAVQLVGRLGTLAIQTTQLGAAAAKMPFISYVSRLSKLLTGRLAWGDALNSPYIQRRLAEMPVSIQLAMEGLRAKKPNAIKHAVQRIGRLLSGTDALFTAGTFAIVYDYQLTKAIKAGVDPVTAGEVARNEAERIVDEIAQPTRQGTRSLFEATATNPLGRVSWAFASEARKNMALIAYTGAKRPTKELSRALFYVIAINGVLASLIRTAWKDLRDDDEDEDEWSLQRMLLSVATEPLYGFPGFGEIAQDAIFAAAGEWQPSGSILDAPVKVMPAIVRAPENFAMLLEGDLEQPLRDLETILMAGGLFNENIAALSSLSHVIRDAEGLIRNFTQD